MKTIQTKPDCTLGFVLAPNTKNILGHKTGDKYRALWDGVNYSEGILLSEITEEQAKELVEETNIGISIQEPPFPYPPQESITTYPLYNGPNWAVAGSAITSLKSAALSVGIEEKDFDKYLVVKL